MTRKNAVRLLSVLLCGLSVAIVLGAWRYRSVQAGGVRMVHAADDLDRVLAERAAEDRTPHHLSPTEQDEPLLVRFPLAPELAATLYPSLKRELGKDDPRKIYCPLAHYVNAPGWSARMAWGEHPKRHWTNTYSQAGFRNPYEPSETSPDVRVVLCGDSHIEAVVPYEETVAALLELGLRSTPGVETAEVLNGASGGYDFYNYLGFLERSLHLRPDVFLVIIYGGNDFVGALPLHAYYNRLQLRLSGSPSQQRMSGVSKEHAQAVSQAFQQITRFVDKPEQIDLALEAAVLTMREMQRICDREGIELLSAYVPPPHDVRPQDLRETLEHMVEVFELSREDLKVTDRLADRFLAELREHGIEMVDLRRAMRADGQRLFWDRDHHLNTRGQYIVARELMPHLRPLLAPKAGSPGVRAAVEASLER